jgi:hypothetical protein
MAGIATLAIAYVLSQFYRSFLAVLTPALTAELGATKAQLSLELSFTVVHHHSHTSKTLLIWKDFSVHGRPSVVANFR